MINIELKSETDIKLFLVEVKNEMIGYQFIVPAFSCTAAIDKVKAVGYITPDSKVSSTPLNITVFKYKQDLIHDLN